MMLPTKINRKRLEQAGFEPDKPVSTMTLGQLFELIMFANTIKD